LKRNTPRASNDGAGLLVLPKSLPLPLHSPNLVFVKALHFFLGLALLGAPVSGSATGVVIREDGAIYLEDLLTKPVKLATIQDAPVFWKIDLQKYLGVMRKGQLVEVQAVSDGAYRVRGQAQQGQVLGWVEPKYLSPLKPDFLASLKQNAARKAEVEALIARNEVAINMSPAEVSRALGRPAKKTSRLDATGREEVWEFVRFERVPQEVTGYDQYGRLISNYIYVKVPAGKLSVVFRNNLVSSLEQTEGALERAAQVKIVAVPFNFLN
jgi:hypothetical protein